MKPHASDHPGMRTPTRLLAASLLAPTPLLRVPGLPAAQAKASSHGSANVWDEVKRRLVDAYGMLRGSFGDAVARFDNNSGKRKQQP